MTTTTFPTAEVEKLTGTDSTKGTYAPFDSLSREELQQLVDIGAADPDDTQNDSPPISEFLDWVGEVSYGGYVIYPPREDARVSIDSITLVFDTAEEALSNVIAHTDDTDAGKTTDGRYYVWAWWD